MIIGLVQDVSNKMVV